MYVCWSVGKEGKGRGRAVEQCKKTYVQNSVPKSSYLLFANSARCKAGEAVQVSIYMLLAFSETALSHSVYIEKRQEWIVDG